MAGILGPFEAFAELNLSKKSPYLSVPFELADT